MFITRVRSDAVGRRLDAGFYNPEFVAAQNAIARFPLRTMESLRADGAPIGYGVLKPRFQVSSVRMVRIQDFNDPFVDLDSSATIDPLQMTEFSRSACVAGDLLVAIGGYPGRLGLLPPLPDGTTTVNINQHVVRVRFAAGVDRYFVTAFLMSPTGRRILARQVSGSVQAGINVGDFRLIAIPFVRADVQRYIGEKVRQAEELRERARRLEAESCEFFKFPEWTEPRAGTRRSFRAVHDSILSERLDAPFYDTAHFDLERVLRKSGVVSMGSLAGQVTTRWTKSDPRLSYIEIGDVDIASGLVRPTTISRGNAPASAQIVVSAHDVLVATVRPNRKNVGLVPASNDSMPVVASAAFAVLRFGTPESAAFYHAFLRSDAATQQLVRWNSGTTYPTIEPEVASYLLVPQFDEAVIDRLGGRWLAKFEAMYGARRLVNASMLLVEHLIDGRITEADLVAAQKALEAGDRSADREILKSLRQSDAPDAKPLIADVDALYALLDSSEGQDP